ncbi:Cpr [Symbiodinium necroappetens]|uniref:Cpr protein n=1 Tax=Symbiodinium necroappetens TaxID=1628268 RepID=A0A812ZMD2_9DINO|nr:Cpr [Symbiodinium necroappetens]
MPHLLFKGLIDGGLIKDLSGDMDWLDFWDRASHEEWGRGHPVLDWSPEDRARAIAISLHGDEGQGKRGKSTMVLSWSPLAVHRPALLNKYPFCVIQADHFHYEGTKNVTLGGLQKCLADSLNMCNQPGNTTLQGYSLHLTVGKGDWKFRREWLQMPRSYLNADLICPRCFASGTPGSQKPWLDPVRERYNNTADLLLAQDSRVGPDIALHSVKGWSPLGEMADLLHAVWIGTARDAVGSLLLDLAEFHPQCQSMTTWDERLKLLHAEILTFCCENGIRQSTIEEISASLALRIAFYRFSVCICVNREPCYLMRVQLDPKTEFQAGLTKLSVEHVTLDYPQGFSKGYANRVLNLGPTLEACFVWVFSQSLNPESFPKP